MFGFFYTLFEFVVYIIGKIKEKLENYKNKIKYVNNDGLTYTDSRCRTRLLSNNHLAMYTKANKNNLHDYVLENLETNKIIKNFTQIQKENEFKQAKENNNSTTYRISLNNNKKDEINGCRHKDINTNEIYVIRKFNEKYYYMNINNGHIIRETDYSLKNIHSNKSLNYKDFNKNQDKFYCKYNWCWCSIYDLYN